MKILSIAKYDLIKLFRDRTALIIILVVPVIFTFIMGMVYGNTEHLSKGAKESKVPVGIVNFDSEELVNTLISRMKSDKTIELLEMKEEELLRKIKNKDLEAGFIIPLDFSEKIKHGETPQIKMLKLPTSVGFKVVEDIIRREYTKMSIREAGISYFRDKMSDLDIKSKDLILANAETKIDEKLKKPAIITVIDKRFSQGEESKEFNGKAHTSIGIAVMFVMFAVILGAGEILDEKKNNTWGRLSTTPTGMLSIMTGKILATFLRGWAQVGFLIIFGSLVMGVSWGNSIFATLILLSVYLLCLTGLGMFLSSLVKTNAQLGAYSSILIVSTSMISGCYWPIEIAPKFMQNVAMLFPQYWAIKGLNNTVNANLGLASTANSIMVLTIMGVLFLTLSVLSENVKVRMAKMSRTMYTIKS